MAVLLLAGIQPLQARADDSTVAGTCQMDLSVTLAMPTLTFGGSGECTLLPGLAGPTADLSGEVTGPTLTCAGGAATGTGSLTIPGVMDTWISIVLVMVGPIVVMAVSDLAGLVGAGVFVQLSDLPDATVDCQTNPPGSTTWTGSFSFVRV